MAKGSGNRKRKKNSSGTRGTRRKCKATHKCTQCNIIFETQNELVYHCQHSSDHLCLESLHKCQHCGELWGSIDQLHCHQVTNTYCMKKQKLPDKMSKIGPDGGLNINFETLDRSHQYTTHQNESFDDEWCINVSKRIIDIKQRQPPTASKMPYSSDTHHKSTYDGNHTVSLLLLSGTMYTLNLEKIQRRLNHIDVSISEVTHKRDIYYSTLLPHLRSIKDGIVTGSFRQLSIDFKNSAVIVALEEDEFGAIDKLGTTFKSYSSIDLDDREMLSFISRYGDNDKCIDDGNNHLEAETTNQLEPVTNNHSSEDISDDVNFFVEHEEDNDDLNPAGNGLGIDDEINIADTTIHNLSEGVGDLRSGAVYDTSEVAMLELHEMLRSSGAPLYLFEKLTKWCQTFSTVFDNQVLPTREQFVKLMSEKTYGKQLSKSLQPIVEKHKLRSGSNIGLTRFRFKSKIMSLLLNDDLMHFENLLLDSEDPFQIVPENPVLGDLNTGWWHRETSAEICKAPNEILLPILLFIDGGKVTERLSVEPVTFTLGIFKREIRNLASAWRTLGYIEDLDNKDSDNSKKGNPKEKLNDYHSMLCQILKDIKELQGEKGGFEWVLNINGTEYQVVFKIAVQVIIGDCQGLDKACAQFGSHHPLMKKLCRDCFVTPGDSDDPDYICTFVKMSDVEHKSADELKGMSMHKVDNAFDDIYFGARTLSVYECTPPEPLHGILLGTMKYIYDEFESNVAKETLNLINKSVCYFYNQYSKQSTRDFPSLAHLQNGVDNCKVLSAKEQHGRLFGIYLALMVPEVFDSLCNAKRKTLADPSNINSSVDVPAIGKDDAEKWLLLMESSLTMYQWIMNPFHPPHTVRDTVLDSGDVLESKAQHLIRKYMHELKYLVGNRKGNGLRIVKFHQILHYVPEIRKDGSILNINTGRCESIAVTMYKANGKRTQRRQKKLTRQIAFRHYEDLIFDEARRIAKKIPELSKYYLPKCNEGEIIDIRIPKLQGSQYSMSVNTSEVNLPIILEWENKRNSARFSDKLSLHIGKRLFFNSRDGGCLKHSSVAQGYTEYVDENGNLYRAHPNYKSDGQWFDWCKVQWEGIDELIPAKIIAFLDLTSCEMMSHNDQLRLGNWLEDDDEYILDFSDDDSSLDLDSIRERQRKESYLTNSEWVVVCSATSADPYAGNLSHISSQFKLENMCRMVPLSSILEPCYCLPLSINKRDRSCEDFIMVKDMKEWSDLFLPEE